MKAAHISGIGTPLGTPFTTQSHIGTILGTLSEQAGVHKSDRYTIRYST